jgi:predicted metal-dependent hydrolase
MKNPKNLFYRSRSAKARKIQFQLKRSSMASQVYLKIGLKDGLEVVVPRRFNFRRIWNILREKEQWILKNLRKIAQLRAHAAKNSFKHGAKIEILGKTKLISFALNEDGTQRVIENSRQIIIHVPKKALAKKLLQEHLRKKTHQFFTHRTARLASRLGLTFNKISVRAQKTRWGSCSRAKNLSFNWRLILTPPKVADYIIIHELCHTVHHNHSKRFYALVEEHCPDYKERRAYLRDVHFLI